MIINRYLKILNEQEHMEKEIGVDLDGTLAYYDGFKGHDHIGKPIPKMMDRVKRWLKQGKKVCIFTARADSGKKGIDPVKKWLKDNGLPDLKVTNVKTPNIIKIWDDRAVHVKRNSGEIIK